MKSGRLPLRILSLFLFLLFLLPIGILSSSAATISEPSTTEVEAVCVMNLDYEKIVFAKNETKHLYPATTAKLVTALVAHKAFADNLSYTVEITREMKDAFRGRSLGLVVGEQVTIEYLLYAMLVGDYNDAAVALAFATAGSIEAFSTLMNEMAASLGAFDTHYTNPTGLHDANMVTTARDTAYIAIAIVQNQTLFDITDTKKHTMPATNKSESWVIYSRNALISSLLEEDYYYSYAEGIHAGSTDEGGDCVVTFGQYEGRPCVCVVLGGNRTGGKKQAFYTAADSLRYSLVRFTEQTLMSQKTEIKTIPVLYSATVAEVPVYPKENLVALLRDDFNLKEDAVFEMTLFQKELQAPFEAGMVVGRLFARDKNGAVLAQTELIVTEDVDAHGFLLFMTRVKKLVLSPVFLLVILIIAALIVGSVYRDKRRRYRRLRRKK